MEKKIFIIFFIITIFILIININHIVFNKNIVVDNVNLKFSNENDIYKFIMDNEYKHLFSECFEGLTKLNSNKEIFPGMSEHWDISEDKKLYTFYLDKNNKWSDGSKVTSEDFVRAIKFYLDNNKFNYKNTDNLSYTLSFIEGVDKYQNENTSFNKVYIKAIDPFTLEIKLTFPIKTFLEFSSSKLFYPMSLSNFEKFNNVNLPYDITNINCNGEWYIEKVLLNNYVLLNKNKYYKNYNIYQINKINEKYFNIESKVLSYEFYRKNKLHLYSEKLKFITNSIRKSLSLFN